MVLALVAGCTSQNLQPYCDASAVTVDGMPLPADLENARGGDPAGCEYFITSAGNGLPGVLSAEMYQGAPIATDSTSRFAVTLNRASGPQRLYAGHGGVLLHYGEYDCTGYGSVRLMADLPDWRVAFDDVSCADGTKVEGEMFGRWSD